jgi:hypothetical protein
VMIPSSVGGATTPPPPPLGGTLGGVSRLAIRSAIRM